jgi:hypothetical protein
VLAGVVLVAVLGEVVRRVRLGQVTFRAERTEKRIPAPKPQS